MENLPRSGLAAPGEVCFSFLERGGEFESSRLLKTAKTAVFASLVRYFYFTPPNSSILSQLFLFSSKPCFLCTKIPHQSAGFLLASRLSTKLGRSAGTRTLGLLLPKQARYQLRNTPDSPAARSAGDRTTLLYIFFSICQMFKKFMVTFFLRWSTIPISYHYDHWRNFP